MYCIISDSNELYHHGVLGMKWGVRRYQNSNGTLTAEGRKKYGKTNGSSSSHRTKLESKYSSMGMNKQQARLQADRRIKLEKALAITAGITLAAAATYAGVKIGREYCDRTIKSGKVFKRISRSAIQNTNHNFYATDKMIDALKYKGMYGGGQLEGILGKNKIYQHKIKINKDIRVASPNTARKVYKDLVDKGLVDKPGGYDLNNKKQLKTAYEMFNRNLVSKNKDTSTFYKTMKDKGYDAIHDMNDMKYSGYKAKNPMIFFNAADKVSVAKTKKLSQKEMKKALVSSRLINYYDDPKVLGSRAAYAGGIGAAVYRNKTTQSQARSLHASGKSNKAIAEQLHISEKQVADYLKKKK